MSVKLMGRVWELDLLHNHQIIALALADHGDDDGSNIYPSQPYVAWKTGYTDRQVRTILRELERIGLIVRVAEAAAHRAVEYRMDTGAVPPKPPYKGKDTVSATARRKKNMVEDSSTGSNFRAEVDDTPGRKSDAPRAEAITSTEPSIEPSENRPVSSETGRKRPAPETDLVAVGLCGLLASLMRANDPKVKLPKADTPGRDRWVREMRLLLAARNGDEGEVEFVIRWCQADRFERANVLSPGKLRDRFTNLLLKAQEQRSQRQHLSSTAGKSQTVLRREERQARRLAHLAALNQDQPHPNGGTNGHLPGAERGRPQLGAPQPTAADG